MADEIACGELYCVNCGDCYACYADDTCTSERGHDFSVPYKSDVAAKSVELTIQVKNKVDEVNSAKGN